VPLEDLEDTNMDSTTKEPAATRFTVGPSPVWDGTQESPSAKMKARRAIIQPVVPDDQGPLDEHVIGKQ
jgi:hypothetical protein